MQRLLDIGGRIAFGLVIFAALAGAILTRPPKPPSDFDQAYYLSVAYDLAHHGVFSNGLLGEVDGTAPCRSRACSSGRSTLCSSPA